MTPKLQDILLTLEEIAPSFFAENWDNPGLQVGCSSQKINKLLIALDPTIEAIEAASERNAQMLLTHHPLIFKTLTSLDRGRYPGSIIFEAIEKKISIISAHTNLDITKGGINDILAQIFGLQEVEILQKSNDLEVSYAGLGRIGNMSEPMKLSAFAKKAKRSLGAERIRVSEDKSRNIKRIAIVGGSGGSMVSLASEKGADLLITGDIKHHEALAAKSLGLALIDAGHFHTEKTALTLFATHFKKMLIQRDMDVIVENFDNEKDPLGYE